MAIAVKEGNPTGYEDQASQYHRVVALEDQKSTMTTYLSLADSAAQDALFNETQIEYDEIRAQTDLLHENYQDLYMKKDDLENSANPDPQALADIDSEIAIIANRIDEKMKMYDAAAHKYYVIKEHRDNLKEIEDITHYMGMNSNDLIIELENAEQDREEADMKAYYFWKTYDQVHDELSNSTDVLQEDTIATVIDNISSSINSPFQEEFKDVFKSLPAGSTFEDIKSDFNNLAYDHENTLYKIVDANKQKLDVISAAQSGNGSAEIARLEDENSNVITNINRDIDIAMVEKIMEFAVRDVIEDVEDNTDTRVTSYDKTKAT